jgi:nucleoside-diphosphate-sugar epimerase
MKVLITGIAGFIGHALATRPLTESLTVYGIDNLNEIIMQPMQPGDMVET